MMDAKVNEHWTGKARIEYKSDMDSAKNSTGADGNIFLNRAYVEGTYGATVIDLGRFPAFSTVDGGMVFDDEMSGGQVVFGKKAQLKLFAGRYRNDDLIDGKTSTLMGIEVDTDQSKKFKAGAAYYHLSNKDGFETADYAGKLYDAKKASIWEVGLGYRFDKNFALNGAYAANTSGDIESKHRRAWSAQLDYKGAKLNQVGSFGLYAAYRHIGNYAVLAPTYNVGARDNKGWSVGAKYTIMQNVFLMAEYFDGKQLSTDLKKKEIFTRVEMYF